MESNTQSPPPSLVVSRAERFACFAGLAGYAAAICGLPHLRLQTPLAAIIALAAVAIPMGLWYVLVLRAHRNESSGLDFSHPPRPWNLQRTLVKYLGFVGTISIILCVYWVLPEYHQQYYDAFKQVGIVLPVFVLLAFPYFLWVDARMKEPADGYWHAGSLFLGRWRRADFSILRGYALGWLVKAFFLPLMVVFLNDHLRESFQMGLHPEGTIGWHNLIWSLLLGADVLFASLGYICTVRVFDSHIRSAEPTLWGWVVALACYPPFTGFLDAQYLHHAGGHVWDVWLRNSPVLLAIWSGLILGLMAIYVWATLMFGFRFSNLTHRGIIAHGPYRWVKHPAYWTKNLSWWLIYLPFLPADMESGGDCVRRCILLLALNAIYWMRAWTEERHLGADPAYQEYSRWIAQHGLLARIRRLLR